MDNVRKADLALLLVTLGWASSYYMIDMALTDLTPLTLNAIRFLGAFGVAALVSFSRLRRITRETVWSSILSGLVLVVVYVGATFGVANTTLTNSGFLCSLGGIFVPILEWIFLRRRPKLKLICVLAISFAGIMLLMLRADFSLNIHNLKGDLCCLLSSVFSAVHLMFIGHAVRKERVDAFQLGIFQLGIVGAVMLALCLFLEQPHLPSTGRSRLSVLYLFAETGLAFVMQAVAQRHASAVHTGLIFTLAPVFAAIIAYIFAHETLTLQAYFGAALIVIALVVSEIKPRKKNCSQSRQQ